MKTTYTGNFEGSVFDPRLPHESKFKRDPRKIYEFFISKIPKIADIKSLKEYEPEAAFISEQMDHARAETEELKNSLISICQTFEVVEKKDLIKKTDAVLRLFESKGFGLDEVKKGIIQLMQIQAELLLSLDVHGGGQGVQVGNARAAAQCFQRLLEVY